MKKSLVLVFTFLLLSIPTFLNPPAGLSNEGFKTLMLFFAAVLWWAVEIVPLAIVGLFIIGAAVLLKLAKPEEVFSAFGNRAVFFLIGAFIISSAFKRSGLADRFLNGFLKGVKNSKQLTLRIFGISFAMSSIMVSYAASVMLLPLILRLTYAYPSIARSVSLALLAGSVIGGNLTPLGGARGPLAMALLREISGESVTFAEWISKSFIPVSLAALAAAIFILKDTEDFPVDVDAVKEGKTMSFKSKVAFWTIVLTLVCWIFLERYVDIAVAALLAVVVLFLFKVVDWRDVEEDVNWGVILMYGGTLTLAKLVVKTGLASWIVEKFSVVAINECVFLCLVTLLAATLTEFVSNSATVAILMQFMIPIGQQLGISPKIVMFSVLFPAGFAMILPTGTPTNAVVLSGGTLSIRDTFKIGVVVQTVVVLSTLLAALLIWR